MDRMTDDEIERAWREADELRAELQLAATRGLVVAAPAAAVAPDGPIGSPVEPDAAWRGPQRDS